MNATKIEWCDYSLNPVKGLCPMACDYCYARRMYKRFKWNPEIRLDLSVFDTLPSEPSRVFVGSTIELFHDDIPDDWRWGIFEYCKVRKQHTFIFLTKQPQSLIKWSPFPENCWVGVTATDGHKFVDALNSLVHIKASVQFISFEPLLDWHIDSWLVETDLKSQPEIKWLIIGQQTPISAKTQPKVEWIRDIVEAADKAGITVFLKNNLKPLLCTNIDGKDAIESHNLWAFKYFKLRQEFPNEK